MKCRVRSHILGFLALSLIAGAGNVSAGYPGTGPDLGLGTAVPSTDLLRSGLLDLSRIDISHSLSYGFSSSSRWGSGSGGLWNTRATYRISNPLAISVDVGALINPAGGEPFLSTENIFLRGVNLDFRPSKHFQLHITYLKYPANASSPGFGPYHDRYGFGHGTWGSPLGLGR